MTHGTVIPKGVPFSQIPHSIGHDKAVSNAGYRVYGELMKLANSESRAWPGHRHFTKVLPMSKPTVATALRNLEETGWVIVDRSRQNHTYTVIAEQAKLPLDWSENLTGEDSLPVTDIDQTGKGSSPQLVKEFDHTDNQDTQPETDNHLATRNVAWDFLTHSHTFNLPSTTKAQQQRVGRLSRELNASLDRVSDIWTWAEAMADMHERAQTWPQHFPDAVMTAEAFVKHFELLGAAPLKRTAAEVEKARTRAAMEALSADEPNTHGRMRT